MEDTKLEEIISLAKQQGAMEERNRILRIFLLEPELKTLDELGWRNSLMKKIESHRLT